MNKPSAPAVTVAPLSRGRRLVIDILRLAARQPTIHGLLEIDVTEAVERMRSVERHATMTGFIVASVGRAAATCPEVNVRRAGRRVVQFHDIAVAVTVERLVDGERLPVPYVVRQAEVKDAFQVSDELRADRTMPAADLQTAEGRTLLSRLPPGLRRAGAAALGRFPAAAARFGPPLGVTSLGMFGAGWGIPLSPLTVTVTVGGTTRRPIVIDGAVVNRTYLPLTVSFDHTVVDGAPAARFATELRTQLETAAVLDDRTG